MSDVFIALDPQNYFNSFLYSYGGNLYQLIPHVDSGGNPVSIQMWKSTDGGTSWSALASTISLATDFEDASCSPCLLSTKLYLSFFASGFTIGLGYFDFTTDTFTSVTTTSSPSFALNRYLAGPDANHLFVVYATSNNVVVGEYVSNAFTSIGTKAAVLPYKFAQPQQIIYGASGVLHILYEATRQSSTIGPSELGYLNVSGGVIGGTIGSNIVYTNYSDSFLVPDTGTGLGPPIQVGTNIYASFYDPTAQALKLLKWTDVSSPTFTVTTIDPSWAITLGSASTQPGTGSWSNVLGVYNGNLYCFYVNTWHNSSGVFTGDSTLYYRSSTDGGVTWSAITAIITHNDPHDGTPFRIWYPQALVFVGTAPSPVTTAELSYNQQKANSISTNGPNGRFATPFPIPATSTSRNYVLS